MWLEIVRDEQWFENTKLSLVKKTKRTSPPSPVFYQFGHDVARSATIVSAMTSRAISPPLQLSLPQTIESSFVSSQSKPALDLPRRNVQDKDRESHMCMRYSKVSGRCDTGVSKPDVALRVYSIFLISFVYNPLIDQRKTSRLISRVLTGYLSPQLATWSSIGAESDVTYLMSNFSSTDGCRTPNSPIRWTLPPSRT